MVIVVVVRMRKPVDECASAIAPWLHTTAYEVGRRLAGVLPRVLATFPDGDDAPGALAARALERGLDVVVCGDRDLVHDGQRLLVRSLEWRPEALVVTARDGARHEVPWARLRLIVRGVRVHTEEDRREVTGRRLDVGRAVLTGGLLSTRKVTHTETRAHEERQHFAYFHAGPDDPVVAVYERSMSYQCLGAAMQPSSLANFTTLVAKVRERAPAARYDERLVRLPALGAPLLQGPSGSPAGNADRVDLLAYALDLADRAGLLGG